MDREPLRPGGNRRAIVDRVAEQIENASEGGLTDRNHNWAAGINRVHTADKTVRRAERDGANDVVPEVLCYFTNEIDAALLIRNGDRVIDAGKRIGWKAGVDDGAENLDDGAGTGHERSCYLQGVAAAPSRTQARVYLWHWNFPRRGECIMAPFARAAMGRFFNWLKAIFNRGMDRIEDPEIMLDQARRDMQQALSQNQEKAIQAITQRNQLEKMLQDHQAKSKALESQATMALKSGDRELARNMLREKANVDSNITGLQATYDQASATVDNVKQAVSRQREEVQKKTAEALALKAQWKQAQIQNSIAKALDGLTFENQFEGFGAAQEKIRTAQSEASARSEMQSESIYMKTAAMEDKTKDYEAEMELQKLEERLGMRPAAAAATTDAATTDQTVTIGGAPDPPVDPAQQAALQSEADKQLEELEKRIKGS